MVDQKESFKPYRAPSPVDPAYSGITYKDLIRPVILTEESIQSVVNESTVVVGGGGVSASRSISTTAPLHGGGDLSADRTLTFVSTEVKLDDLGTPDDNTDLNASTANHGLLRKLDNNAAHFLDGTGAWAAPTVTSYPLPYGYFGDGSDGDLTLGSDTTLSSGDNVKLYNDVNLAGFTLYVHQDDWAAMIQINGTLTGGGGRIALKHRLTNAGPAGVFGSGTGGASGGDSGLLIVRARNRTGSVTIDASGETGGSGGNASNATGTTGTGGGTAASIANAKLYGALPATLSELVAPGNPTAGTGLTTAHKRCMLDVINWFYPHTGNLTLVSNVDYGVFQTRTGNGDTGNSGGAATSGNCAAANGSGGGAFLSTAGAGGANGANAGPGAAGGSGGGGGPAGIAVYVSLDDGTNVTVNVTGGNGGAGGAGAQIAPGPGGGGGGSGGYGYTLTGGSTLPTVNVTGGTGGAAGTGAGGGANGSNGNNGGDGRSFRMTLST